MKEDLQLFIKKMAEQKLIEPDEKKWGEASAKSYIEKAFALLWLGDTESVNEANEILSCDNIRNARSTEGNSLGFHMYFYYPLLFRLYSYFNRIKPIKKPLLSPTSDEIILDRLTAYIYDTLYTHTFFKPAFENDRKWVIVGTENHEINQKFLTVLICQLIK